jgi:hypothetical protein
MRVFSSSSREGLAEQLEQENKGVASTSVTAAQFLQERLIQPQAVVRSTSAHKGGTSLERGSIAVISQQAVNERDTSSLDLESRGMSALERRREELESGPGGDHDLPYNFSLPLSLPPVLVWMTVLRNLPIYGQAISSVRFLRQRSEFRLPRSSQARAPISVRREFRSN